MAGIFLFIHRPLLSLSFSYSPSHSSLPRLSSYLSLCLSSLSYSPLPLSFHSPSPPFFRPSFLPYLIFSPLPFSLSAALSIFSRFSPSFLISPTFFFAHSHSPPAHRSPFSSLFFLLPSFLLPFSIFPFSPRYTHPL